MRSDDTPVGRLLTRREVVALLGIAGSGLMARHASAAPAPACVVRPEQTEGPYFVEERLVRSDIRSDPASGEVRPGAVLQLAFNVSALRGDACAPLPGVVVDVWHCDALGAYSDVRDPRGSTVGQKFLRGAQTTDAAGAARFMTIYPGWYQGRAVHIHFKVRTAPAAARGHEFTSQIYFDDAVTDQIHALEPYARRGQGRLRNDGDGLFRHGGRQLLAAVARSGQGYATTFDLAVSL
ncbi:MAG TPA: intradiol ring-cleavage dioxygenase [Candidatus Acidoferrum sp.]|jgi:protocatechuate 3,4-dioxygenase beta subunit|nr:intradiol ring-cleavage dioxygenase [Candidatus Acidoferrum sp.]